MGVNNPHAAHSEVRPWPLPPRILSPTQTAPQKGHLSLQEQPKRQNKCQTLLGTRQKRENSCLLHPRKLQLSAHPRCGRCISVQKMHLPAQCHHRADGPLGKSRVAAAHEVLEEITLGFLQGSCESPQGSWQVGLEHIVCNDLGCAHGSPTFQPWLVLRVSKRATFSDYQLMY